MRKKIKTLCLYGLIFILVTLLSPWIGAEKLEFGKIFLYLTKNPNSDGAIFWFQRVPRVILALLAGGALSVVGASLQVLLRNPLVEPFTIGISGGASLGAFLAISIPSLWVTWGPLSSTMIFSLAGASLTIVLIYFLAKSSRGLSIHTLLLAGITISIICSGSILLLTYLSSPNEVATFHRWIMGGIDVVGYQELLALCPFLFPGLGLLFYHSNDLNQISLGEEMALGHGVAVKNVQRNVYIGAAFATAAVVSLVGPIAFVGLVVPHAVRELSGFDQRFVLPGSFLLGGASLAACDSLARTVLTPTELPVGIITALLGGPLFIRLLIVRRVSLSSSQGI